MGLGLLRSGKVSSFQLHTLRFIYFQNLNFSFPTNTSYWHHLRQFIKLCTASGSIKVSIQLCFLKYTVVLPISCNKTWVDFPFNNGGFNITYVFTTMSQNISQMFVELKTTLYRFINYLDSWHLFFGGPVHCKIEVQDRPDTLRRANVFWRADSLTLWPAPSLSNLQYLFSDWFFFLLLFLTRPKDERVGVSFINDHSGYTSLFH